jgi:hypothetical protein
MEGIVTQSPPDGVGPPADGRRHVTRLTVATAANAAAVGLALAYVGVVVESHTELSDIAPFHGWQLWVTEIVIGAVAVAVMVVAGLWSRRTSRGLPDHTPHRRAVVMAVLVPALALGALLGQAARPALSWASSHTAAAAAERSHLRAVQRELQRAPLPAPVAQPPAPAALAASLISRDDLGDGWYPATRPDPVTRSSSADVAHGGAVGRASSWFVEAHRAGNQWILGLTVDEIETRFRAAEQAATYLRQLIAGHRDCGCGARPDALTRSTMNGTTVWLGTTSNAPGGHVWAAFTVGDRVFTVIVLADRRPAADPSLRRPLRLAVARANRPT